MSDPTDHVPYVSVDELSEDEWNMVHSNFLRGAQELDLLIDAMKRHFEAANGNCSGPWCAPPEMIMQMEDYSIQQLALLLHQAVYRLGIQDAEVKIDGIEET